MYLKLGTIGVNYITTVNDFMIVSEIVDSQLSFQSPQLIRTVDELDIWFGKNFNSRDYLLELLKRGISLYLYKPISPETIHDSDYIDLDELTRYSTEYGSEESLPTPKYLNDLGLYKIWSKSDSTWYIWNKTKWVLAGEEDLTLYTSLGEYQGTQTFPLMPYTGYKYYVYEDSCYWIWDKSRWLCENLLPQNIDFKTKSLDNRDTLIITRPDLNLPIPEYCYPEYKTTESHLGNYVDYTKPYRGDAIENMEDFVNGTKTLALRFKFSGDIQEGDYIILPTPVGRGCMFCRGTSTPAKVDRKYYPAGATLVSSKEDFLSRLQSTYNYIVKTVVPGEEYLVIYCKKGINSDAYFPTPIDATLFYSCQALDMSASFEDTQNIFTQYVLDNDAAGIEMWSKTIGRDENQYEDESLIWVEIESEPDDYRYQITIGRYDYSEIFTGSINPGIGEERLDEIITNKSKLIYCNFLNTSGGLRTGKYYLRRAGLEKADQDYYMRSLKTIFDEEQEEIFPDYFFVPDVTKYTKPINENLNYYKEYIDFLNCSRNFGCQFLIQNYNSPYKIIQVTTLPDKLRTDVLYRVGNKYYNSKKEEITDRETIEIAEAGGNYIYNYTGDKENRLVYFWRDMTIYGRKRPGWYIYLNGLFDDTYSASTKTINYDSPITYPYQEDNIRGVLERYKTNYVVSNNQIYYYEKYMNGKDYITSGWMRFIVGKIYRELQKCRGKLIASKNIIGATSTITEALKNIEVNFSIVKNIDLASITPNLSSNSLSLTIDAYIKDLVDNNISLGITVNYNKT